MLEISFGKDLPRPTITNEGKATHLCEVQTGQARNALGWARLENDLALCVEAAEEAMNLRQDAGNVDRYIYSYFVSTYGRCFTDGKGRAGKLQVEHVPSRYTSVHQRIMHARHNVIAHSGDAEENYGSMYIVMGVGEDHGKVLGVAPVLSSFRSVGPADWRTLHELASNLRQLAQSNIEEKTNNIQNWAYSLPDSERYSPASS